MSYRDEDDDYNYSDDSFVSDDEVPRNSRQKAETRKSTTAPRKDDGRGRGRGRGRGGKPGKSSRGNSQAVTPRVDPVIQRVLSARKLRINELRNNMEDLIKQIEDLKEENKLLKKTQYRQEKALNRFEDRESDLPQIMQRHNNEVRTVRDQLRKTKEKYDRTDRYLRDAEDELDKVKSKMKKFKKLVDDNDLLERDELQSKVKKSEIDMEEKEVKIKELERHINNLTKNHRHELGIEMARNKDSKKQMDSLREENERLEKQLREKVKELEMKNIYANRMVKPGSRVPNSYSGTPLRQTPPSPRRRRPPSVHDLNPREKVKLYEERRKEEERRQREKRAAKSKSTPKQHGGSFSPRKPVSTDPIPSRKNDYSSKPWLSNRQKESEKPWLSDRRSIGDNKPWLYEERNGKADDKPNKAWRVDGKFGGNKTPSSKGYNDDYDRAPSAGSREWDRMEEQDTDDSYSRPSWKGEQTTSYQSPRNETSKSTGKTKWPWEKSGDDYSNVSKKPSVGNTRIYASPPSGKSRYPSKYTGKKSSIASTPTYTAGQSLQKEQKAREQKEREIEREREEQMRQEEEEAKRKERWEQMERERQEREDREQQEREKREQQRRDREERERHEREEKDRREAEEWKMKLEREKMKREAEERKREMEERDRRDRERKEQERRAEEERERMRMDEEMAEERRKKDLLLAKLREIDDSKKANREKDHDPFFLTNKADSDVGSTSSSKKSYQFSKPIENLHEGKWSHEDVSVPYLEKQKKQREKEKDDVGGYQPSFGRRADTKKTTGKKTGGEVIFNSDFAKPPKAPEKKKDLMSDLFGSQTTKKTNNSSHDDDDDIFSSSNFDTKKTTPAKLSLFDDEPKQTTTKRENSLSLFGGGSALLDDDISTKDSTKLLPRRRRQTSTFQSRPAVTAVDHYDEDIEEVIL